jgi:hypothetical protein
MIRQNRQIYAGDVTNSSLLDFSGHSPITQNVSRINQAHLCVYLIHCFVPEMKPNWRSRKHEFTCYILELDLHFLDQLTILLRIVPVVNRFDNHAFTMLIIKQSAIISLRFPRSFDSTCIKSSTRITCSILSSSPSRRNRPSDGRLVSSPSPTVDPEFVLYSELWIVSHNNGRHARQHMLHRLTE